MHNVAGACGKGVVKGVLCGVWNSLLGTAELSCGAIEQILEGPCKYAAVVPVVGVPAAFSCGLATYVGGQMKQAYNCLSALYGLKGLGGTIKELAVPLAEFTCELITGIVIDVVVNRGAGTATKVQKALTAIEHVLLSTGSKAADRILKARELVTGAVGAVNNACHTSLSFGGGHGEGTTSHGQPATTSHGSPAATTSHGSPATTKPPAGSIPVKPRIPITGDKQAPEPVVKDVCRGFPAGALGHPKAAGKAYRSKASWDPRTVLGKMDNCETFKMMRIVQAPGGGAFVEFEHDGQLRYMLCLDLAGGPSTCK
jgi:hypothetical protein